MWIIISSYLFSFIRCKDRKLALYSRYDIFVPYVHIFRFYIRSSKTSWETAIVMADSSLPYLIYYSTPVAYHYGPFILNNASSQESGMVKRELVGWYIGSYNQVIWFLNDIGIVMRLFCCLSQISWWVNLHSFVMSVFIFTSPNKLGDRSRPCS